MKVTTLPAPHSRQKDQRGSHGRELSNAACFFFSNRKYTHAHKSSCLQACLECKGTKYVKISSLMRLG